MKNHSVYIILLVTLVSTYLMYTGYMYTKLPDAVTETPEAAHGKRIWQQYNCNACHQFYGQGGFLGPDLTNVMARRDTAYVRALITYGSYNMPNLHLSNEEVTHLMAFLQAVNATGNADLRSFKIQQNGTIQQTGTH